MDDISFWESAFLWRDAMIVAVLAAAVLSYLGVWVALKRVVYVPLALSQVAGLGVILSFWFCSALDLHETPTILDPEWMSLGFAVATVLIRLALTAPRVVDAGLGVTATIFAIALTWVYNRSVSAE